MTDEGLLKALRSKLASVNETLADDGYAEFQAAAKEHGHENALDWFEDLERRLDAVEDTAIDADKKASTAMATAGMADDGIRTDGNPSKTDIARQTARDHLVKEGLRNNVTSLPISNIDEMCGPSVDLAYQTAKDAATSLASRWDGIAVGTNEAGNKALKTDPDHWDKELVAVVEESLGRDDLTKQLISRRGKEGGR